MKKNEDAMRESPCVHDFAIRIRVQQAGRNEPSKRESPGVVRSRLDLPLLRNNDLPDLQRIPVLRDAPIRQLVLPHERQNLILVNSMTANLNGQRLKENFSQS
jgi:hypothetical protein